MCLHHHRHQQENARRSAVMVLHSARYIELSHCRCTTSGFFIPDLCLHEAFSMASRFVKSRACIACMDLHPKSFTAFLHSGHIGRGLAHSMHLHEKRCIKRAGVAGIALRASMKVPTEFQDLTCHFVEPYLQSVFPFEQSKEYGKQFLKRCMHQGEV